MSARTDCEERLNYVDSMLVSVIIPIYNVEAYLSQCLDSVIAQTYSNLEVLLINDGSTDGSLTIANQYAANDPRIVVVDKPNEGVAATRNVGIGEARGEYVQFVDADDWIQHDMIQQMLNTALKCNCDIVSCGDILEFSDGKTIISNPIKEDVLLRDCSQILSIFLEHKLMNGALRTKLFKRSLFNGLQFDPDVSYGEDALLVWKMLQRNPNISLAFVPESYYHYRMNNTSISHSFGKLKFTAYKVWKTITDDTERLYPDLLPQAQASFCNQMTVILYNAAINGYQYDENIQRLQDVVRKYRKILLRQVNCSIQKKISLWLLCAHYNMVSRVSSAFIFNRR